jgi:hypothetical protein
VKFDQHAYDAARGLSEANAQFLEFVSRNPEGLNPATFANITQNFDWYCYQYQLWPTFIDGSVYAEQEQCGFEVDTLVKSLIPRYFEFNPEKIAAFYGLKAKEVELYLAEPDGIDAAISRVDVIQTSAGFKVMEINAGSYVGGWESGIAIKPYLKNPYIQKFLREHQIKIAVADPTEVALSHFMDGVLDADLLDGDHINIGMLFPSKGSKIHGQYNIDLYQPAFREALAECEEIASGNLLACYAESLELKSDGLYHGNHRLHALFEQHDQKNHPAAFRAAKMEQLQLFSGPITMLLTDKRNLALISSLQQDPLFEPEEQAAIAKYIPWTRHVKPTKVDYKGETAAMADLLVQAKQDLVLKRVDTGSGEDVFVGRYSETQKWEAAVARSLSEPNWILQEFLPSQAPIYLDPTGTPRPHDVAWGLLIIGGTMAASFGRMMPRGGDGVVNSAQGATETIALELA